MEWTGYRLNKKLTAAGLVKTGKTRIHSITVSNGGTDDVLTLHNSLNVTELVTNGAFAADTDWTKGTGWAIAAGKATKTAGTASDLSQTIAISPVGIYHAYKVVYTVTWTAGTVTAKVGGTSGTARGSSDTFTEDIICGTDDLNITFSADATADLSIDDVSVTPASVWEVNFNSTAGPQVTTHELTLNFDVGCYASFTGGAGLIEYLNVVYD